jgi:hypothetical protein
MSHLFPSSLGSGPPLGMIEIIGGKYVDLTFLYRFSNFFHDESLTTEVQQLSPSASKGLFPCESRQTPHVYPVDTFDIPVASSVLEMETNSISSTINTRFSLLTTGFLFMAALDDHAEALVMLARRYENELGGLGKDVETAAIYASFSSIVASDAYHTIGGQPVLEVMSDFSLSSHSPLGRSAY